MARPASVSVALSTGAIRAYSCDLEPALGTTLYHVTAIKADGSEARAAAASEALAWTAVYITLFGTPPIEPDGTPTVPPPYWFNAALAGLADVNVAGVDDADVLGYDIATNKWTPRPQTGGGGGGGGTIGDITGLQVALDAKVPIARASNTQTGTAYTFVLADAGRLVTRNSAGASTQTIPTNATVPFPVGTEIVLLNLGAGAITINGAGVTLGGDTGVAVVQGRRVIFTKVATDTWNVLTGEAAGAASTAFNLAVQRALHTGSQAISTVTGLQTALDAIHAEIDDIEAGGGGGALVDGVGTTVVEAGGVAQVDLNFGTGTNQTRHGNDAAYTNARTPTTHAASHASGGGDPVTLAISQITGLQTALDAKESAFNVAIGFGLAKLAEINTQTGTSYTLVSADASKTVEMNNGGAMTVTVPTNASVAYPVGTLIEIVRLGAGTVTINHAGVTVNSPGGVKTIAEQYGSVFLRKRGEDEWVLSGGLG